MAVQAEKRITLRRPHSGGKVFGLFRHGTGLAKRKRDQRTEKSSPPHALEMKGAMQRLQEEEGKGGGFKRGRCFPLGHCWEGQVVENQGGTNERKNPSLGGEAGEPPRRKTKEKKHSGDYSNLFLALRRQKPWKDWKGLAEPKGSRPKGRKRIGGPLFVTCRMSRYRETGRKS